MAASLAGRWILTAGLGGMGGAQPLAATMAGASCLAVECQPSRIEMRLRTGYLDAQAGDDRRGAGDASTRPGRTAKPISVGLLGNAAEVFPELLRRGVRPDAVTDQTSAHDPINGYLPRGWTLAEWEERRERDPKAVDKAARASMAIHVRAMLDFHRAGVPTLDYGNNIRQMAKEEGVADAFDFPGFVPAYIRPLFCRGVGPFRWAALSGDPEDIYRTDAKVKELMPDDGHLHNWLDMARERIHFQGLPARICWVGLGDRHRLGLAFNEMVASGELKAPIVIGRDHLDSGSVASPNRETEAMRDGSDAVSDWPLLNALLNCASGATWVSLHHGGGVGMGFSQHSGMVVVCDGTPEAAAPRRPRAVERPGDRRDAPCRRRLPDRARQRASAWPRPPRHSRLSRRRSLRRHGAGADGARGLETFDPGEKGGDGGERFLRPLDEGRMAAAVEHQRFDRRIEAPLERADLGERAVLIGATLDRQHRNADIVDRVLDGPLREAWIEPGVVPAAEGALDIAVMTREARAQIALAIGDPRFCDRVETDRLGEEMRRHQDQPAHPMIGDIAQIERGDRGAVAVAEQDPAPEAEARRAPRAGRLTASRVM